MEGGRWRVEGGHHSILRLRSLSPLGVVVGPVAGVVGHLFVWLKELWQWGANNFIFLLFVVVFLI